MQLSEQAKAALERLRNSTDGVVDYYAIADEMLRFFPVKTLNGVVIRWDDEIIPERIFHSGFASMAYVFNVGPITMSFTFGCVTSWRVGGNLVPKELWPTNMGEVWRLMEKCECPVGSGE